MLDVFPDAEIAWFAETDKGASAVLAHHYPDIPNLGDIATIDYSEAESVDLLTAGFPCQDISVAGLRKGLRKGTRTGLWYEVARAIRELRPPLVFLENTDGLLSGEAACDLEWCDGCLGEPPEKPVLLRALGAVLGDLASLGFDACWRTVRASDAGAPHKRTRVFVLAAHPDRAAERARPVERRS